MVTTEQSSTSIMALVPSARSFTMRRIVHAALFERQHRPHGWID